MARLTPLAVSTLALLAEREMHPYEMYQLMIRRREDRVIKVSAGSLYRAVERLASDRLIAANGIERAGHRPERTVYAITDAGRAELAARESELDGIESGVTDSVRRLADEVRSSVNDAMKTLRADLASAARDAREDTRGPGFSVRTDEPVTKSARADSRVNLQEAEVILAEFRHQVRSDLRKQVAHGELPAASVALLKTQLDAVRQSLNDTFTAR